MTLLVIAAKKRPPGRSAIEDTKPLTFTNRLLTLINHQVIVNTRYPGRFEGILTSVDSDFVTILGSPSNFSAVFIPLGMISSVVLINPRIADQVGL